MWRQCLPAPCLPATVRRPSQSISGTAQQHIRPPFQTCSRNTSRQPAPQCHIAVFGRNFSLPAQEDTYVTAMAYVPVTHMTAYAAMQVGRWNLGDLVKDPSSDEFNSFLRSIEEQLVQFERSRQSLRPDILPTEFEGLIHALEGLSEKISIASGYAHLRYYADTSSNEASALVIKMEKLASDIGNRTLFFDLWFKRQLDDENADRLINAVPQVYREYLRHKRLVGKYSLSEL